MSLLATITDIATLVVCSPETCGGRPHIAGTWISVQQIATLHKQGLSVTNIISEYEFLNLAQVYATLAYYYANQNKIEAYLIKEEAEYARLIAG